MPEDDPRLDDEDKALARFQAQRIREAKKAAKFHLSGDDSSNPNHIGNSQTLTHGGRSLEELEELNSQPAELLGDLDDDILEDLVQQYHFGGGGEDVAAAAADGQQRKKTKKEVRTVRMSLCSLHYEAQDELEDQFCAILQFLTCPVAK